MITYRIIWYASPDALLFSLSLGPTTRGLPIRSQKQNVGSLTISVACANSTRRPVLTLHMSLVLVTGVSGFVGSHVALELLNQGHRVRGTVRGAKKDQLQESLRDHYPNLELVQVDDIVTADLTDVLAGVAAIMHVASPLGTSSATPRVKLNSAIGGTLNVLQQAVNMKIKKVVVTGSWGAALDPAMKRSFDGKPVTEQDWGDTTEEEILSGKHGSTWEYMASKILAEKATWKFAEEHPSLDVTTINPPFIYGPFVPHFPVPVLSSLGSNRMMYCLLEGETPPPLPPLFCDVRDVARAHVAALKVPPKSPVQEKRILISGGIMPWEEATQYLSNARPELTARLPALELFASFLPSAKVSIINVTRAKNLLYISTWIEWKRTVDDTVNELLRAEGIWAATVPPADST